ncbi:MAG: hypothetical protein O0W93_04660 [Methanocorpusculum sp.]|nr:hypothetical protein [Methanocorpusculum sp.]
MQKKWIILSILLVLLAVLLAPLIFTLYVNISDASIYYDVSITGLENRTVSEPVTILVPLPLIRDTSALPEEKLPKATNGWNLSFVETEHGQMLSLTSTEPVLRNPDLSIWQYFPSAFDVQVTNAAQLHFSTENRSTRTALIHFPGLTTPEQEQIVIDVSFQTSSKYEDLLMQPNNMRGIYSLSAIAVIPADTESGWIALPIEERPRNASYLWFTPDTTIPADDPQVIHLNEEDFAQHPALEILFGGKDPSLAAWIVRDVNDPDNPQPFISETEAYQLRFAYPAGFAYPAVGYIEWNGTVYRFTDWIA